MIRVLQFAGCINRHDFIDTIIQHADPRRFAMGVAVGTLDCNFAEPRFGAAIPRWLVPWKPLRGIVGAAYRLAGIMRDWKADILHTHHYDEALIGWLATRLNRRTKLVVGRHYSTEILLSTTGLKRSTLVRAEQIANRGATRIIAPSSFIVDQLTRDQGVCSAKVDHVPYAFVAEKYAAHTPTARPDMRRELEIEGRFAIGSFARMFDVKGHRFLLEAMAQLRARVPEASLLLVGDGPARGDLERLVRDRGLGNVVRMLGWRRDTMAVMSAVDAVVQPTLSEAFSQAMVEALWMAKPLVMTDVSGARDVIRHGENGLLVPPGDPRALAHAIERLAGDPPLRASLARYGRAYVENNLSIEAVIPRYERAYSRAMGVGDA
jgi:glycosyltransferase involved in cell wall biosynthesis